MQNTCHMRAAASANFFQNESARVAQRGSDSRSRELHGKDYGELLSVQIIA